LNIDLIRSEFPLTSKYAYFDHAAVGPLPTRVLETTKRVVQEKSEGDIHWESWEEEAEAARKSIAGLVGAREEDIALTTSTSEGLAIVANGLSYSKDHNIVTCDMEFASNLFPWQALAKRYGVELRVVRNHEATLRIEDFSDVIDAKTKLVAVSYVQYSNGFRTDLSELSKIAHENGAYVVTDAVQAVGQMPINVANLGVDFLASSGYKWLLSPISTGFLYVKQDLLDELWPTIVGYRSDENPMDFSYRPLQLAHTARRYEAGQLNFPGFAGMKEAIGLLQDVGMENVWSRIRSHIDLLRNGIEKSNTFQIRSSMNEKDRSGILNLACQNPDSIADRLFEHGIVISVRGGGLRISPHFYNTEQEIDKLLSELNAL
jgi:cysteine desulfurase/selenocysteine lyase